MQSSMKLYDLVHVAHDEGFTHCGQIISKVYVETCGELVGHAAVQVRLVPGDPETITTALIDLPDSRRPCVKTNVEAQSYKWVHYAKVSGAGSFPVDMLRYDFAAPVNFTLIHDECRGFVPVLKNENDKSGFIVARCTTYKNQTAWTQERWASFQWDVEELETLKI